MVDADREPDVTRRAIEKVLREDFAIEHTTLQVTAERLLQLDDG